MWGWDGSLWDGYPFLGGEGVGWTSLSPSHPMLRSLRASYFLVPQLQAFWGARGLSLPPGTGVLENYRILSPALAGTRPHPMLMCGALAMGALSSGKACTVPVCEMTGHTPIAFPCLPGPPPG